LRKVIIKLPDGTEWLRGCYTDHFIHLATKLVTDFSGSHGNGHDDPGGPQLLQGTNPREEARAGSDTIVDKDDDFPRDADRRLDTAIGSFAAFQFSFGLRDDPFEVGRVDCQETNYPAIENANTTRGDRSEGDFLLARDPELSDDEYVEGGAQRRGNFEGDGDSPARNAQYDDIVSSRIFMKPPDKASSCFLTISKYHASTLYVLRVTGACR
jgi:hypothetical protein